VRPTLLILAAGRGSRFGGPKQLAPVGPNGEPLLAYTIHDALRGGFARVVLACPEGLGSEMGETFRGWAAPTAIIDTVEQVVADGRSRPWGTGHAVLQARERLTGRPFGVANGDDFYGRRALEALGSALSAPDRREQVLVSYTLERTMRHTEGVSRGLCRLRDGGLEAIDEVLEVRATGGGAFLGHTVDNRPVEVLGDQPVSMNLWGFVPPFLKLLDERWTRFRASSPGGDDEFLLPHAVGELITGGGVTVETLPTDEIPFGLTRPQDLETARAEIGRRIASGDYPADLRSGST